MKKILITGANGMIGSALVNEFINKYELILIDPYSSRTEQYKDKAIIINKDLSSLDDWKSLLDGVYCVVHLAAAVHWVPKTIEEEKQFVQTNAEGTKSLFKACSVYGVERFLFFSTNDVYKYTDQLITEDTLVDPKDIYGKSKLLAEEYLLKESGNSKSAVCIFRPASVYGNNDTGSMKSLITFCRKGIVPMIGNGTNKKALLYLKDIVMAVERYIESEDNLNGEVFNISSGDYQYKEIINTISNTFKIKPFKLFIPKWFCKSVASKVTHLKKLSVAAETKIVSNNKALKLLGYEGKYSLKDGLADAKSYYSES